MNNRNNYNTEDSARKVRQLRQKTQQLLRHLHYQQQHPDPLIKAVREAVQRSEEDLHSDATTINKPTGRDLLLRFDETRPPPAPRQLNAGSRGKSVGRQSTKSLLEQQFEFRQRMQRSVSPLRRRSSNRQSTSIETSQLRYGFHSSLKSAGANDDTITMKSLLDAKPDTYFTKLQQFRQLHADLFFPHQPAAPLMHTSSAQRLQQQSGSEEESEAARRHRDQDQKEIYLGGYFRLNQRYFAEQMRNPFMQTTGELNLATTREDDFNEADRPCKISIPKSVVQQRFKRQYQPRTRRDYDPQDSISIGSYLHQGFAPFGAGRRREKEEAEERFSASFRQQLRQTGGVERSLGDADHEIIMVKENLSAK